MFYLLTIILTFIALAMIEAFFDWTSYELLNEAITRLIAPFITMWIPVRCLFKPVAYDLWISKDLDGVKVYHLFKNIYLLNNTRLRLPLKFLFVRVQKPLDKTPKPCYNLNTKKRKELIKMTEKTIYIADDGKEFNDEVDCRLYERECRINPMFESGAIVMWDRDKKRTFEFDEAFYVFVKSLPAARVLKDICWEDGYECPCYNLRYDELETGKFYYDEDYDKWHNLDELKFKYNSLCEIFAS